MDVSFITQFISPELMAWGSFVLTVIGTAATAAAQLPAVTEKSSGFYKVFRKVLDLIGQNYKNAKNA